MLLYNRIIQPDFTRKSEKIKTILVNLKSGVGSTEKGSEHEPSFICTQSVLIALKADN